MSRGDLIPLAAVAMALLAASVTDLWKFKVYNALTFPTLVLGLAASSWLGGWHGLQASLLGAGVGLGLLVFFFAANGVGPGDVKLLTAVGAWLGPILTFQVFLATVFAAGLYAVAVIWAGGGFLAVMAEVFLLRTMRGRLPSPGTIEEGVLRPDRRRRLVPVAAMTFVGFLATLAWWGHDLERAWPPYHRPSAVATASNFDPGGAR